MQTPLDTLPHFGDASKRLAQRVVVILENRLELLMVEVQQEREQILLAVWLALGAAVFGLLAGIALSVVIVIALWEHSPIAAMLVLTALYAIAAVIFYARLSRLQRAWQTLPATIDQLRKDRECLENQLS